ncbi:serine hydrolase domain-containing protein [Microbacterium invictum]|nr:MULTISPECIES: serine hydrolase domain-containing protein [Microbacterium]
MHRVRRAVALVGAAALALTLAACAPDPTSAVELPAQAEGSLPEDTTAQLQAAVEYAMAASGSPGAIVGVWVPWAGTWVTGLGTTKPDGAAVDTNMTFGAGYVTRAMTCDVLYALSAEGALELGDSVTEWVPGLPGLEDITLGQLCDSSSGLGAYTGKLIDRLVANPARSWAAKELVAYGMSSPLTGDPGSAYRDSDTGYVLLGLAVERAGGESVKELYERYVAEPLGLKATGLAATPAGSKPLAALRSSNTEGKLDCSALADVTSLSATLGFTAGGVTTNITELGRYTQALATGARPYDTAERYADPYQVTANDPSWFTAKGGTFQAGSLIGHYGSYPGYLTAAFADRETGMTVAVVLNNSRGSSVVVRALAWQLAAIASKVPGADGAAPEAGLPWTAESLVAEIDDAAICS